MVTETTTIDKKLEAVNTEQARVSICVDTIKETLEVAIPYYTKNMDTLHKYGDARFALGYLGSLINRLLPQPEPLALNNRREEKQ